MTENISHSFNIEHARHIGLNDSIVYHQLYTTTSAINNSGIDTTLSRLHICMPYFTEEEILESLTKLNMLEAIAFQFVDNNKQKIRLAVIGYLECSYDEDED